MTKRFVSISFLAIILSATVLQPQAAYAMNPRVIRMATKGATALKKVGKLVGIKILADCIASELKEDSTCLSILKPKQSLPSSR